MRSNSVTDQDIIDGLNDPKQERHFLKVLYRDHQHMINHYVVSNSGDMDEAADVFQEGLVVLYKHIKEGKFRGESTIKTYLYSICRFIWLKKLRKMSRETEIKEKFESKISEDPYIGILNDERSKIVSALLDTIGEQCKQVLIYAIFKDHSMEEIAEKMNYKSEQIARNKKFKCLKKLKEEIAGKPEMQEFLKQL